MDFENAKLAIGSRVLWQGLNLQVEPGELIGVIGPNGSGKTSLLKVILGQLSLSEGSLRVLGAAAGEPNRQIGYVPQLHGGEIVAGVRGRDFVGFGIDGHRWGLPVRRRATQAKIEAVLSEMGAEDLGSIPVGLLSGGQQQRLRIAQAIVGNPRLLLLDEPFLSLDLGAQAKVMSVIGARKRSDRTAVILVTHDVNPIVGLVDRLLYFSGNKFILGTVDEVLKEEVLSEIYGTRVEVRREGGNPFVIGVPEALSAHNHELLVAGE